MHFRTVSFYAFSVWLFINACQSTELKKSKAEEKANQRKTRQWTLKFLSAKTLWEYSPDKADLQENRLRVMPILFVEINRVN